MVKIRLFRFGKKKQPFYRIVVADSRKRRDGSYIDWIGFYNPVAMGNQEKFRINKEKAENWLQKGAQPSDTVLNLLTKAEVKLPSFLMKKIENKKKKPKNNERRTKS
ncbi:MAG: 30S ribosomal protein S16 [Leptonema sp. (in: bacteria)]